MFHRRHRTAATFAAAVASCFIAFQAARAQDPVTGLDCGLLDPDSVELSWDPADVDGDALIRSLGPIAYWRLGDSNGVISEEISSLDGSYTGGVSQGLPGALFGDTDSSVRFTGSTSSYGTIPHDSSFLLDAGSVSLWVRPESVGSTQGIFSKEAGGLDDGGHFRLRWQNDSFRARLGSTSQSFTVSSGNYDPNCWYHVAVLWGPGGLDLYVDGVLVDSDSYTGGWGTTSGGSGNLEPIVIGADSTNSNDLSATPVNNPFLGRVDDVALFDRRLTPGEILQVTSSQTATGGDYSGRILARSPVAYYEFGDLPNGTETANGYDGSPDVDVFPVPGALPNTDAALFNNSDGFDVPVTPELQITSDLTIAFWVRNSDKDHILSCAGSDSLFEIKKKGDGFEFKHEGETKTLKWSAFDLDKNPEWASVVIIRNGASKTFRMYTNGVLEDTESFNNDPPADPTAALTIGSRQGSSGYKGELDELVISDRVWSAAEINDFANSSSVSRTFQIRRDGSLIATLPDGSSSYVDSGVSLGDHEYCVRAIENGSSSADECCTIRIPTAPTNLICGLVGNAATLQVGLDWSTEDGVDSYLIRRDGVAIATVPVPLPRPATLSFADTPPAPGDYDYTVAEVVDGVAGPTTLCTVSYAPGVTLNACDVDGDTVVVSWINDGSFDSFDILVDGVVDQSVGSAVSQATIVGLSPPGAMIGVVGVISGTSSPAATCEVEIFAGPTSPTCCSTETDVEICWSLPSAVDEVLISRDGSIVGSVTNGASCFTDLAVPSGPVTYTLQTRIGTNFSLETTCSTVVLTPPSLIDCLPTSSSCDPQGAASITWSNTATYDEIEIFVDGVSAGVLPGGDQQFSLQNIAATSIVVDVVARRTVGACAESASQCSVVFEIDDLPELSVAPVNATLCPGDNLTLTGAITGGSLPIDLQWLLDGAPISGATSASYSISAASESDEGVYALRATNLCGVTTEVAGPVVVRDALTIASFPMATTACPGDPFSFSVVVTGTGPFTYAWSKDGSPISGADQATFSMSSADSSDAGSYSVVVTGPCSSETTPAVTLMVDDLPTAQITTAAGPVCPGTDLTLTTTITGTGPFTFEWTKDGAPIAGADQASLVLTGVAAVDAGAYAITATSDCGGSVTSSPFTVVVLEAPTVSTSSLPAEICEGDPLSIAATAMGDGMLTYEWKRDGVTVATTQTLDLGTADPSDDGSYVVTVTGTCGSIDSAPVVVSVTADPSITMNPQGQLLCSGGPIDLSVVATGGGTLSYQWFLDGAAISGATSATYQVASPSAADEGTYTVQIQNGCGSVTSNGAVVSVGDVPTIAIAADTTELCDGSTAILTATVNFQEPLVWERDGQVIAGESGTTLVASVAGTYVASSVTPCGSATSNSVVVTELTLTQLTSATGGGTVCLGEPLSFSASATGSGTISYEWFRDGVSVATSSTLSIPSASLGDSGSYTVVATGDCGSATSAPLVAIVNLPVSISAQPSGQLACDGEAINLSVTATGTAPLTYQWSLDGSAISGATDATLSIPTSSASDAGTYTVTIMNPCGSVTSSDAVVTTGEAATISISATANELCAGDTITLTATTNSTDPLTWFLDGSVLAGETGTTLVASAAGSYTALATALCGDATSNAIAISELTATGVTAITGAGSFCSGEAVTLSVTSSGSGSLTTTWTLDGTPVGTGDTLSIPSVSLADAGSYIATVVGDCGSAASAAAVVTVTESVTITMQPQGQLLCSGGPIDLSVVATGGGTLSYQWFLDGAPISGATSSTYQVASPSAADEGTYTVEVANVCGSMISSSAVVSVGDLPQIAIAADTTELCDGSTAILTATVNFQEPIAWQRDGQTIAGESSTMLIASVAGTYVASSVTPCGSATSNSIVVTELTPTQLTSATGGGTVCLGEPLSFSASATGSGTISYEWFRDGTAVATGATLSIPSASLVDAGSYTVVATGDCGSDTSSALLAIVNLPVSISAQPSGQLACDGEAINLSVTATGTAPLTYQWSLDGAVIPGATDATLSIPTSSAADAGTYTVTIMNPCGSLTSSDAIVTTGETATIAVSAPSTDLCPGDTITLTATTNSTDPLTWFLDGSVLAGETGTTLVASAAGSYTALATALCGDATSNAIAISELTATGVTAITGAGSFCSGEAVTLSVTSSGSGSLTTTWTLDGTPVGTGDTLSIPSVSLADAGSYIATVVGDCGSAASAAAVVTVTESVTITMQPQGQLLCSGGPIDLSVVATGGGTLSYQWFLDGAPISGATSSTYQVASPSAADEGTYTVEVANVCGSMISSSAVVSVGDLPQIAIAADTTELCDGSTAILTATVNFQEPIAWQRDGQTIAGESSTMLIASVAGTYVASSVTPCGSATSNSIVVTELTPTQLTSATGGGTVCLGEPLSFSASATGSGTISYEWFRDGTAVATGATLSIPSASLVDAGSYTVVATGDCGSDTSSALVAIVNEPVSISAQPSGQIICDGDPINLSVMVTGSEPLSYQWSLDGAAISGATAATLSIPSSSSANEGTYTVVVMNPCGSVTSNGADITTGDTATISIVATANELCPGDTVTLTATTNSTDPLTWFLDGSVLAGETGATLVASAAGSYTALATALCGDTTSNAIAISELTATGVTAITGAGTFCAGEAVTLSVTSTGSGTLTTTWTLDGTPVGTGDTLSIPSVSLADAGSYIATVVGDCGSAASAPVGVTVQDPVSITVQPSGTTACDGDPINLSVMATGSGALSYQWFLDGAPIAGATSSTLSIATSSASDAGSYTVEVENPCNTVLSNAAVVTVGVTPALSIASASTELCPGDAITLTATTNAAGPLAWFLDGGLLAGETGATLNATAAGNYTAEVSGSCGIAMSNGVTINAATATAISQTTGAGTYCAGEPVTLTATATGSGTLQTTWTLNGDVVSTADSFTIPAVALADAGSYIATVVGDCGSESSAPVDVIVQEPVTIATQPATQFSCEGDPISLSVIATGSGTLTYQWFFDGAPIPGATSATLMIPASTETDEGSYSVEISNPCGVVASGAAVVTVGQTAVIQIASATTELCPNETITITATTDSTGPITWSLDGTVIGGETGTTLVASVPGTYTAEATSSCGVAMSNALILTELPVTAITQTTGAGSYCVGDPITLTVTATGSGTLTTSWTLDGTVVSTASSFTILSASVADSGSYVATVTGDCETAISTPVDVIVQEPITINAQPTSQFVCEDDTISLSIDASGSAPLTYQWFFDGAPIVGATSATLTIPNSTAANEGSYMVDIDNPCGSAMSGAVDVTVGQEPTISIAAPATEFCPGDSIAITATTDSTEPVTWFLDGAIIAGETGTTINATAAGTYSAEAGSSCGSATSNQVALTELAPTVITQTTGAGAYCTGDAVTLTATSTGSGTLQTSWSLDGTVVSTGSSFTIPSISASDAGGYVATVVGDCGSVTSSNVNVIVQEPVTITAAPMAQDVCSGGPLMLSVGANGSGPLSYQWLFDGSPINGANGATLQVASPTPSDSGMYSVMVDNNCNSVTTTPVMVTVGELPQIQISGDAAAICSGTPVLLTATTNSTSPIEWQLDGATIGGEIGTTLSVTTPGTYTAVAMTNCGTQTSDAVVLTAPAPISIDQTSGAGTYCGGQTIILSVDVTGGESLTTTWFQDGVEISSGPSTSLAIGGANVADSGTYTASVQGLCDSAMSSGIDVTVTPATVITSQPVSVNATSGDSVQFSVVAAGTAPLTYQWQFQGFDVVGGNSPTLSLASVSGANIGGYQCVVTGPCGIAVSQTATLTLSGGLPAVTDLTCCRNGILVDICWTSPTVYDFIQVFRDGQLVASLGGSATCASDTLPSGDAVYTVVAGGAGQMTNPVDCMILAAAPPLVTECVLSDSGVSIEWTNEDTYSGIEILRDGVPIANLAGTATSFDDLSPLVPTHIYTINGTVDGVSCSSIAAGSCQISGRFLRGDSNQDGGVNLADVVFILSYLFGGGASPLCLDALDTNDTGSISLPDAVNLVSFLFSGGMQPMEPYPNFGADPTDDNLDCGTDPAFP